MIALLILFSSAMPTAKAQDSAASNPDDVVEEAMESSAIMNLRDPFLPPKLELQRNRPRTPLEYYPVEAFRMLGVVTGPKRMRALVVSPDGKTHFVAEGDIIGTKEGKVRSISSSAIHVEEKIVNVVGQVEILKSQIELPADGPTGTQTAKKEEM